MKKRLKKVLCEFVAAVFLGAGALLLIATYLPIINPNLFRWATDEQGRTQHYSSAAWGEPAQPLAYYFIGTPLSVGLLSAAWYFNLKALKVRDDVA